MSDEERLEAIEANAAYQERLISELNGLVYQQAKRIDRLEALVKAMAERVASLPGGEGSAPGNERPPHY